MSFENLKIRSVNLFTPWLLLKYLYIRFQTFVIDDKRKISYEFDQDDLKAKHYLFCIGKRSIGIVRVTFNENEAMISRFGFLRNYRSKGYGSKFMELLLEILKTSSRVKVAYLFTEEKTKDFYLKIGFSVSEIMNIDGWSYTKMVSRINI